MGSSSFPLPRRPRMPSLLRVSRTTSAAGCARESRTSAAGWSWLHICGFSLSLSVFFSFHPFPSHLTAMVSERHDAAHWLAFLATLARLPVSLRLFLQGDQNLRRCCIAPYVGSVVAL